MRGKPLPDIPRHPPVALPCADVPTPPPCCSPLQVPFRLLKNFHKIQQRLVRELEKKFSGKDVVVVANRRIMPPPTSGKSNARPRSRTLTAVREPRSAAQNCGGGGVVLVGPCGLHA